MEVLENELLVLVSGGDWRQESLQWREVFFFFFIKQEMVIFELFDSKVSSNFMLEYVGLFMY